MVKTRPLILGKILLLLYGNNSNSNCWRLSFAGHGRRKREVKFTQLLLHVRKKSLESSCRLFRR